MGCTYARTGWTREIRNWPALFSTFQMSCTVRLLTLYRLLPIEDVRRYVRTYMVHSNPRGMSYPQYRNSFANRNLITWSKGAAMLSKYWIMTQANCAIVQDRVDPPQVIQCCNNIIPKNQLSVWALQGSGKDQDEWARAQLLFLRRLNPKRGKQSSITLWRPRFHHGIYTRSRTRIRKKILH